MLAQSPRIKLICFILSSLTTIFGTSIASAKDVNLYDRPSNDAKMIGKVDVAQGVVPIISQPDGQWVKVGDPRNGNVGWIKSSDLGNAGTSSSFSFSQQMVKDANGVPINYQIFRYGDPNGTGVKNPFTQIIPGVNGQPIQDTPANMQKNLNNMVHDLNEMYKQQQKAVGNMPVIMPNIVMPQPVQPAPVKK